VAQTITSEFAAWLRQQHGRQDDIGALARRVAEGRISLYRPDDSRVVPPAQVRRIIARAQAEHQASRKPKSAARARNSTAVCKGCGHDAPDLVVRTAKGAEAWHGRCRNQARFGASSGRQATGLRRTTGTAA
jgi:hypothetical protein